MNGDIATWFVDAVCSALQQLCTKATVGECYATSGLERFPQERFHDLPANRRYGVWVHAVCNADDYRFFWDSLEEAISSFDINGNERIIRCSRFRAIPDFRDRITSAVDVLVRELCCS